MRKANFLAQLFTILYKLIIRILIISILNYNSPHKTCFFIFGDTLHVLFMLLKIVSQVRIDWLYNFLNNKIVNGNEMEQKQLRLGDDQGHFISKYYKSL